MSKLLLKEWVVNRTQILTLIIITLIIDLLISSGKQLTLWFAAICASLYPFQQQKNEEQVNVFLNSLPIDRALIVTTSYISSLGLGILFLALIVSLNGLIPIFDPTPNLQIVMCLALIGIFIAVFYPLYYLLGPRFIQIGMTVLFILGVTGLPIFINLGLKNDFWGYGEVLRQLSTPLLSVFLLAGTLVALFISHGLAVRIYMRKQF